MTKFDPLGLGRLHLQTRAKEISAFVTPDGLHQYKVMPFGMKNSPASFQRLVNRLIFGLDGCKAYIDEAVLTSTHNVCFGSKIRKLGIPCKPQFYYINLGFKGVHITQTCYPDNAIPLLLKSERPVFQPSSVTVQAG